jgi:hypothetical protein
MRLLPSACASSWRAGAAVVEKKMMGHLAFMVNGAMCCSVGEDGLLVWVGVEEREKVWRAQPIASSAAAMSGPQRRLPG